MNLEERIKSLATLKKVWLDNDFDKSTIYQLANQQNNWFTNSSINSAIASAFSFLEQDTLENWLHGYNIPESSEKKVGVIMAGNIPLVGFHDWLCVLLSGKILYAKLSSQDQILLRAISEKLIEIEPRWSTKILFVDRLNEVDAIIATGSNNSARYFQYYFSKKPHIIRKNRVSVAILDGLESPEEIIALGKDVFTYFGLGCRNVSKLFVPKGFEVAHVYSHWEEFAGVQDNHKYKNNYDYQRSMYLINQTAHFDNNFLIMKESKEMYSPIGVLYFEYYENIASLSLILEGERDNIQAIVAKKGILENTIYFGEAQTPFVSNYADGIDTIEFLNQL
ncbi:MAG: acyl-CoA reductase [Cytophagales bacterium]|nr:MAG: acyl-CoA reductase [Cytophagales bacterium]